MHEGPHHLNKENIFSNLDDSEHNEQHFKNNIFPLISGTLVCLHYSTVLIIVHLCTERVSFRFTM